MEETTHISRSAPALKSQDFAFLREEAMELLRSIASETWTDHNLHDPGITLLEAFCYALTEMGLRSGMDVKDLVASDISDHQQNFYRASEILPVAPVTGGDIRKILIDHSLVKNAWLYPTDSSPGGRFSVLLEFSEDRLNSNTFNVSVEPASLSDIYQIDLALPWWDEEEVIPFGDDVEMQTIDIDAPPGEEWRTITGDSTTYYTKLDVTFQPPEGGTGSTEIWVIAGINTPMEDPVVEAPLILSELTTQITAIGDNSPSDQELLKRLNRWVSDALEAMRSVQRYLKDYRNLCEEFTDFSAVRPQEIAISANIDVKEGVQIENLLADIFLNIDRHISPQNVFEDLITLQEQQTNDQIYEGPLLDSGFLPDTFMSSGTVPDTLYTSDILRVMLQVHELNGTDVVPAEGGSSLNITSVRNLSLSNYLDNRPITTNARDCLGLVESRRHIPRLSPTKSHITAYRNGVELETDNEHKEQAIDLFKEKKEASQASQVPGTRDVLPPEGNRYAVNEYYPAQNDLPLVYGVGETGLPESASDERRALALQLQGYLFFFEQLTAGVASQLAHFNAFFSADPDLEQTLFQQPLYHLSGAPHLLKSFNPPANGESFWSDWEDFTQDLDNGYMAVLKNSVESVETDEQFFNRRNRVLDHLLASFGEDLRDRASFLLPMTDEKQVQLIQDKSAFIHDLPELGRSRAQSFGNPVFRKKSLLQMQSVQEGIEWVINDMDSAPIFRSVSPAQSDISGKRMAAETLTLATSEDHYSIREEPGGQHRVVISASPEADPVAESVSTHDTLADAETAVENLLQTVMELWMRYAITPLQWRVYHMLGIELKERKLPVEPDEEDQGFYMVEHLLLAPALDSGTTLIMDDSKDPYSFQITFLFPSGYVRDFSDEEAEKQVINGEEYEEYRDPEYRKFAETQIRKACPAHILPRVLWIDRILEGSPTSADAPAFENFEQRYRTWLEAWFTDGITDAEIEPLQNDLVEILNLIYQSAGN